MEQNNKYLLVDTQVLPAVFLKVVQVKRLIAQGKAKNLSEATKLAGISRSAFYKYKDCVFPYEKDTARQMATVYAELVDEPGVLSLLLSALGSRGANILTINQSIPVDGVAPVSISMRTDSLNQEPSEMAEELRLLDGVVNMRVLSN